MTDPFAPTYADVVWPALVLVLEQRLLSVYTYHRGTDGRMAALRFGGFGLSWKRSAVIEVVSLGRWDVQPHHMDRDTPDDGTRNDRN
jgi:hypothetical protein